MSHSRRCFLFHGRVSCPCAPGPFSIPFKLCSIHCGNNRCSHAGVLWSDSRFCLGVRISGCVERGVSTLPSCLPLQDSSLIDSYLSLRVAHAPAFDPLCSLSVRLLWTPALSGVVPPDRIPVLLSPRSLSVYCQSLGIPWSCSCLFCCDLALFLSSRCRLRSAEKRDPDTGNSFLVVPAVVLEGTGSSAFLSTDVQLTQQHRPCHHEHCSATSAGHPRPASHGRRS